MKCEQCKKEEASSLSYIGTWEKGRWILAGACTKDTELYYIEFARLKQVDWVPHMMDKNWFKLPDFAQAMMRAIVAII